MVFFVYHFCYSHALPNLTVWLCNVFGLGRNHQFYYLIIPFTFFQRNVWRLRRLIQSTSTPWGSDDRQKSDVGAWLLVAVELIQGEYCAQYILSTPTQYPFRILASMSLGLPILDNPKRFIDLDFWMAIIVFFCHQSILAWQSMFGCWAYFLAYRHKCWSLHKGPLA